jgi:hypothetical protein
VEEAEEDRVIEGVIEGMPVIVHTEGLVAGELLYVTYPGYFSLLFQRTRTRFLKNSLVFTHSLRLPLGDCSPVQFECQHAGVCIVFFYIRVIFFLLYIPNKITGTSVHHQIIQNYGLSIAFVANIIFTCIAFR